MKAEYLLRKKTRIRKQEKRRLAKTSATLAGQMARARKMHDGAGKQQKLKLKIAL